MPVRFGCGAIAICVLSLVAVPAMGSETTGEPVVGILSVAPQGNLTPDQAEKARAALSAGFNQFRVRVIEDHPAVQAAHGVGAELASGNALAEARIRFKEGKKLFDDLDQQGAEAKLRQAADLFEANAGALSTPSDLIGTYLLLARVFFATEREVLARDIFRRTVQLQPDLVLDRAVYPPGMISVFDDVKKAVLASPLGSLEVTSAPFPARVFLDGRERGMAPVNLVNLVAGVHTLSVRRPGYAPWVRPVDITTFRVDKIAAQLVLDRFPSIELAFTARGTEQKDSLGLGIADYLDAVASAAGLDVVVVGRLSRSAGTNQLEARAYRPNGHTWGTIQKISFSGAPPRFFDKLAGEVLVDAVHLGWIPPVAARRTVAAGGGALDETAHYDVRLAFVPAIPLAGATNFPSAPGYGFRLGLDDRLGPRLILTGDTGFDYESQTGVLLTGSSGSVVASRSDKINATYLSIPLDVGFRYYMGVGTLAPYLVGGAGVHYDSLSFSTPFAFDHIKGGSGIGFEAFGGAGADYAVDLRNAVYVEARAHAGTVGVSKAVEETSGAPNRLLPVKAGANAGIRFYLGYLRVF